MNHLLRTARGGLLGGIVALCLLATPATAQYQSTELDLDALQERTRKALDESPTDSQLRLRLVKIHFVEGAGQLDAGRHRAAVDSFRQGLRVVQEGYGEISDSAEVVKLSNYALAHALRNRGMLQDTIEVLEGLTASNPDFFHGRYMLGVLLMSRQDSSDFSRGMEVMEQLYRDSSGSDQRMVATATTHLAYEYAIDQRTGSALETLRQVRDIYGESPSSNPQDNLRLRYAMGRFMEELGDLQGAVVEYQAVYNQDSSFRPDSTSIGEILANAYYQAGLNALQDGNGSDALDAFQQAERVEGEESMDVLHGQALAYRLMGRSDMVDQVMSRIEQLNPSYYRSITEMQRSS